MASNQTDTTNSLPVILGWVWVGIPLAWGIYNTLLNVVKLFQ